jgi:hypothetical protein
VAEGRGRGGGRRQIRTTKSQVAFRRRRGFAYLWLPSRYLAPLAAEVVHPSPAHSVHHLEVTDVAQIDAEVAGWLREAAERAP